MGDTHCGSPRCPHARKHECAAEHLRLARTIEDMCDDRDEMAAKLARMEDDRSALRWALAALAVAVGEMPTPDVPHYVGTAWEQAERVLATTGGGR